MQSLRHHRVDTGGHHRECGRDKLDDFGQDCDDDDRWINNMTSDYGNLIRLRGAVQEYDWGNTGSASLVAKLSQNALGPDFKVREDKSYAEVRRSDGRSDID